MAKRIFSNFRGGINAAPAYYPQAEELAASEIRNMEVNTNGELVLRESHQVLHKPWASNSTQYSAPHYLNGQTKIAQTAPMANRIIPAFYIEGGVRKFRLFVQRRRGGLYYWDGSAWTEVTINPPNAQLASHSSKWAEPFSFTQYGNRLYLANGDLVLWTDVQTPSLHWWGITPNSDSGYTQTEITALTATPVNTGGGNLAEGWYSYVFTYINSTFNIESLPSARVTVNVTSSYNSVQLKNLVNSADPQIDGIRIYRTEKKDSSEAAVAATLKLLTIEADKYELSGDTDYTSASIFGASTVAHADVNGTLGMGKSLEADEFDNPPKDLKYIISYGNRIWAAKKDSSKLYFCKEIDGTPIPDAFPDTNADIRHNVTIGDFAEPITGIAPDVSGQQLQVFKTNSITMVRGWGTISGLYTPNTAIDMDASMVNNSAGTSCPWSIVTEGGKTFFLGSDKQIWTSVGGQLTPISTPVQPILDQLPVTAFTLGSNSYSETPIHACGHDNKYYLAIPTTKIWHNIELDYPDSTFERTTADTSRGNLNYLPKSSSTFLDPPDTVLVYDILKDYWTTIDFRQGPNTGLSSEVELENQLDGDHRIGQYLTASASIPKEVDDAGDAAGMLLWGKLQNLDGTDAYLSYSYPRRSDIPLFADTPLKTSPSWTRLRSGRDHYATIDGSTVLTNNESAPIRLWKSNWLMFPAETTITGLVFSFNDFSEFGSTPQQSFNYMLLRDDQNFWNYLGTSTSTSIYQDPPKKGIFNRSTGQHRASRNRVGLFLKCRRIQLVLFGDNFYQLERVGLEFNPRGEI